LKYGIVKLEASAHDLGRWRINEDSSMEDAPKTLSVPEAGKRYFGLARNASYAAVHKGALPVIRIGSRLRVPVIALERMLSEAKPEAQRE
jgi:hypothetical protein